MAITIRLTNAQTAALECRGLEAPQDELEELVARCWDQARGRLTFEPDEADDLWGILSEMSNAEDAQQQETGDVFAGRAARSLASVASKVIRAIPAPGEEE